MSRSWYGEQRQETLSWTRRSSWCTQSVGKILVSASRMAFRRAWWISDTSSVCVRSVRNMEHHSLTHSLSRLTPTNQPTDTEVESSRVLTTFLLGQTKTISLPCMIIAKWYHSKRRHLFGIPIFGNRNIRQINSKTSSRVLQREISM